MTIELAIALYREMLRTAAMVAAPILGTAMIIGLVISLIQTVTSINEQTLTFVPKIIGIAIVVAITLPWILGQMMAFLAMILANAPALAIAS
ncbi:MAG: flagellar biosynthetic protein FliQ [Myxococcota bacterium]